MLLWIDANKSPANDWKDARWSKNFDDALSVCSSCQVDWISLSVANAISNHFFYELESNQCFPFYGIVLHGKLENGTRQQRSVAEIYGKPFSDTTIPEIIDGCGQMIKSTSLCRPAGKGNILRLLHTYYLNDCVGFVCASYRMKAPCNTVRIPAYALKVLSDEEQLFLMLGQK
ncbi:Uncharacterised protein [uncultured archaeon]|nr:Uncharacterised protein [uncultured archaeon]